MKRIHLLILALPCLLSYFSSAQSNPSPPPNIILIMADDIRADNFGCYGSTYFSTPNIDKLAATGTQFNHCHSNPLCTPSRVKIMTGRSNVRNYIDFGVLDPKETTFAPILKKAGYTTAIAGKWQLHYLNKGTNPKDAHFDQYSLWNTPLTKRPRYWNPSIEQNGKLIPINTKTPTPDYGEAIHVNFINNFIRKNKSKPFFVYYPMMMPHFPFDPTPDSKNRNNKNKNENYRDMVAYMDKCVGQIVNTLDELKLRKNTIILFTGDNGTDRVIKYQYKKQTRKGEKSLPTVGGTHVPLIVNMPGTVPIQKRNDLIDFSDFFPTLTDIAKTSLPKNIKFDGQSFYPQILGQKGNPRDSIFIYYFPRPYGKSKEYRYALNQQYKLYSNNRFFNYQQDPAEQKPLNLNSLTPQQQKAHTLLQNKLNTMPKRSPNINYTKIRKRKLKK